MPDQPEQSVTRAPLEQQAPPGPRVRTGARVVAGSALVVSGALVLVSLGVAGIVGVPALPALALAVAAVVVVVVFVRRGRARVALGVAAAAVPIAAAALVGGTLVAEQVACDAQEQRVLEQIPHLNGVKPGVAGDIDRGGCVVRYTAPVAPRAAVRHYERVLTASGWVLLGVRVYEPRGRTGELFAERGVLKLSVFWSADNSRTHLSIFAND